MGKMFMKVFLTAALIIAAPFWVWAEEGADFQKVEMNATALTENIYYISDTAGMGNMVVSLGPDGAFMVDSKAVFLEKELKTALDDVAKRGVATKEISPENIYLLNSHCHFDHVDGNRIFAGRATIIAHKATYDYLTQPQQLAVFGGEPYPALTPETGLPNVTFADVLDMYFNGTRIQMVHLGPGHTGGDVVTIFTAENIIHMGDLMFNGMYPYIGINEGGSINSMIEAGAKALELMDDKTVVVPGHGPVTDKATFLEYNKMLTKVRDNIAAAVAEGKTLEEVVAMQPTREFDAVYGQGGPLSVDKFVELCYMDLIRFK